MVIVIAVMPKSGTQINAPMEPMKVKPHARFLKARIPPMELSNIPSTKIMANTEDRSVLPPNPIARIIYGKGDITHVRRKSSFTSTARVKAIASHKMLKVAAVSMNTPETAINPLFFAIVFLI